MGPLSGNGFSEMHTKLYSGKATVRDPRGCLCVGKRIILKRTVNKWISIYTGLKSLSITTSSGLF